MQPPAAGRDELEGVDDAEVEPNMFGEWVARWGNPVAAQKLCFGIAQYYRNVNGSRRTLAAAALGLALTRCSRPPQA